MHLGSRGAYVLCSVSVVYGSHHERARECGGVGPTSLRQLSDSTPTVLRQSDSPTVRQLSDSPTVSDSGNTPSLSYSSDSLRQWSDSGPTGVRQSDSPTVRQSSDSVRQSSDSVRQLRQFRQPGLRIRKEWRGAVFVARGWHLLDSARPHR